MMNSKEKKDSRKRYENYLQYAIRCGICRHYALYNKITNTCDECRLTKEMNLMYELDKKECERYICNNFMLQEL